MLKVGIIGAGRIGKVHAKTVANYPGAEVVTISDPNIESAEALAAEYGGRAVLSADEVINDPEVQAVIICSPTPLHPEHILACAKAGKPAMCEKPVAMDIADVENLKAELAGLDPVVMLGFNRRFDPNFGEIKRRVEAGEIGELEQLTIISRDPAAPPLEYIKVSGGIFKDMTIHDFDMAHWFLGDVATVTAVGQNLDPELADSGDFDGAIIILTNKAGKSATIINSRHDATGYDQRLEAFGNKGALIAENQRETTVRAYNSEVSDAQGPFQDFFLTRYEKAYTNVLVNFLHAIENNEKPTPGISDGEIALRIAVAAEESARTGMTVRL